MNSRYFIDDKIVAKVLEGGNSEKVKTIIYDHFEAPFSKFFEKKLEIMPDKMSSFYKDAFELLETQLNGHLGIQNNNRTIFYQLIECGMEIKGHSITKDMPKHTIFPFLAGEVLVKIIYAKDSTTFNKLFEIYKTPTLNILDRKYSQYFNITPKEVYGESMMILKSNIEKGKISFPLTSRLFTYFFLIAKNKFLQLGNKTNGVFFYKDLKDLEYLINPNIDYPVYTDYLKNKWPCLSTYLSNSKDQFTTILSSFEEKDQAILKMRFYDNMKFKNIGKQLNIKESTCRKRIHDCLKKWRRQLFRNYIINRFDGLEHDCLQLYLISNWTLDKIACKTGQPKEVIDTLINNCLENWRSTYTQA